MGFVDTKIEEVCVRELDRFGYVTSSNHKIIESGVKRVIHLIEDFSLVLVVGSIAYLCRRISCESRGGLQNLNLREYCYRFRNYKLCLYS